MIGAIRDSLDRFRGVGDHALSIPSLDGAFRPNDMLENAEILLSQTDPENIVACAGKIYLSSGLDLLEVIDGVAKTVSSGTTPITAMVGNKDGQLAIARSEQAITLVASDGSETVIDALVGKGDVTALAFAKDGGLAVAIGAAGKIAADWRFDLMEQGRNGSVWRVAPNLSTLQVADGLAYPFGIVETPEGELLVSLAWEATLVRITPGKRPSHVLKHLPGYPSRIVAAEKDGGYWLAVFAPRNQLVEFVLRETKYKNRMMAEIQPEYWICPALKPATSPLEVMQNGAQKIGGAIKPWAPTMSYGMIVKINENLIPDHSLHSRSNGNRHGITSVVEFEGHLLATTSGGAAVLKLEI